MPDGDSYPADCRCIWVNQYRIRAAVECPPHAHLKALDLAAGPFRWVTGGDAGAHDATTDGSGK